LLLASVLAQAVCQIAIFVGDFTEAERSVELLLDITAKGALNSWNALGYCLKGVLLLARDDVAGTAFLQQGLDRLRKMRFVLGCTMFLGALAQGLAAAGQTAEAHQAIDEALERADRDEERLYLPELLRIKGELLLSETPENSNEAAQNYLLRSLDEARRQEALSWELRAAMSLAELWRQNGNASQAIDLLSAVYGRFTEGFETRDVMRASALLSELASGSGLRPGDAASARLYVVPN
jgi:predicted ATPase